MKTKYQPYRNEQWCKLDLTDRNLYHFRQELFISNYGRITYFDEYEKRQLINLTLISGYPAIKVKQLKNNKSTTLYIHRVMAELFLYKKENDKYVIHLDYDKNNNNLNNLKWATKREKELHQYSNDEYLQSKPKIPYSKINEGHAKIIRKLLLNGKTRKCIIAKRFGISHTQVNRIERLENWK